MYIYIKIFRIVLYVFKHQHGKSVTVFENIIPDHQFFYLSNIDYE